MLYGYFDASARQSGTYCVAGVAFGVDNAAKAANSWKRIWGDTPLHMTDLHNRKRAFRDWTGARADGVLKKSTATINRRASFLVAASISSDEFEVLRPTSSTPDMKNLLAALQSPFGFCTHLAMMLLGAYASTDGVSYIAEDGDGDRHVVDRFIGEATQVAANRSAYKFRERLLFQKADVRLLETADFLAWEWARHVDRLKDGYQPRRSLAAIVDASVEGLTSVRTGRCHLRHFSGLSLQRFGVRAQLLLNAESMPEIQEALVGLR